MGKKKKTHYGMKKSNKAKNGKFYGKKRKMNKAKKDNEKRKVVVGTFEKSRNFGFVVPDGKKVSTDIFIPKKYTKGAKNGDKVLVKLTKEASKNRKVEGEIIQVIGKQNAENIDFLCIVKEFELPEGFPKEVRNEVNNIKQKIDVKEIPYRMDFRDVPIYTIDGEDAKDLDDAISIGKAFDGNYILGVHIADVSNYVTEGSSLDKEAIYRGTSVYLLDRVIPMLPFELSNGICSLNAGEDRFTLSIIMEIDENGKVVSSKITKGIINVKERMSYKDVQSILDGKDERVLQRYSEDIEKFKLMAELANILKKRRKNNGYLSLDIPETKVILNEQGRAIDIKEYESTFANEIIEQFMLTANEEIAKTFEELQAPFIYRVHETPDLEKIDELNKILFDFGYKIEVENDNIKPIQFAKILDDVKGKNEEALVSKLILRTLKLAKYEPENKGHFGIASKYYCHFTSPIRRYPDLFIHRVISEYLLNDNKIGPKKRRRWSEQAKEYAERSSARERLAQEAEREADNMKMAEYMEDKIGEEFDGIISSVTEFGVFVELENTVEGLIRFDNLGKEYYDYDEKHKCLIGHNSKEIFKIGDKIRVKVIEASKALRRISFERIVDN